MQVRKSARYSRKANRPRTLRTWHPLARGLRVALLPFQPGMIYNRVAGPAITVNATASVRATEHGIEWRPDSVTDNGLALSFNPFTGATPRTMLMGVRRGTATDTVYWGMGPETTNEKWALRHEAGGTLRIEIEGSGYTSTGLTIPTTQNEYYTVGCTYTGGNLSTVTMFLDGIFETVTDVSTTPNTTGDAYLLTDPWANADKTGGDEGLIWCYMWDRALSQAELLSVYANPFLPQSTINSGMEIGSFQMAYPSTDTVRDNWEDESGGTTNIYTHIDEAVVDTSDYIRTQFSPSSDVYATKLDALSDPTSSTGHVVRFSYSKVDDANDQIDLTVELRQGYVSEVSLGTLIATVASLSDISATWTMHVYELSSGEADSITDYSDLYLRFVGNAP